MTSTHVKRLLGAMVVLVTMLSGQLAWAQNDKTTIAIHLEGTGADKYRKMIVDFVPEGLEVMSTGKFTVSLRKSGLTGGRMGYAITSQTMRKTVLRIVRKSVKRDELAGAIVGRVRSGRKGTELVVMFVNETDELVVDEAVLLKGTDDDKQAAIANVLLPPLEALAPAKKEEPKPEETPDDKPTDVEEDGGDEEEEDDDGEPSDFEANRPGSELFNVALGAEFGGRFFDYSESEANTGNLRPYDVFGVPAIAVSGEVYPAATLDITFLSDLGIGVSYMRAFGLDSATADNQFVFGTEWSKFSAGLRYRLRVGDKDDHPFVVAADMRMGFQSFSFEAETGPSEAITNEIATVNYFFFRPALDARLPLADWFAVLPSFGVLLPLDSGETYDRFTDSSVLGLDAGLLLSFVVGAGIELRGGAEYTRYFSKLNPQPGDPYVAGGALDQYLALRVGGAYVF